MTLTLGCKDGFKDQLLICFKTALKNINHGLGSLRLVAKFGVYLNNSSLGRYNDVLAM